MSQVVGKASDDHWTSPGTTSDFVDADYASKPALK